MTNSPEATPELLAVTQADRDAAACFFGAPDWDGMDERLRTLSNVNRLAQAFARHRLASTPSGSSALELNPVVVAITEAAVLHLDADEDNAPQLAAFEQALLPILTALRNPTDREAVLEALTPSGDTKAAYMGEFSVPWPVVGEDGDDHIIHINVPWTTIKEIMAAIRARALKPTTPEPSASPDVVERLRDTLDTERYKVTIALQAIKKAIDGRRWLSEPGRGSYTYDDERYQQEFGAALDEIDAALEPMRKIASDWSECPTDPLRVAANRAAALNPQGEK